MTIAGWESFILDFLAFLNFQVFERIATDSSFSDGFYWGLGLALGLGFAGRMGIFFYDRITTPIRNFFRATRVPTPSSNLGPTPASMFGGCVGSVLLIIILVIAIMALASGGIASAF